MEEEKEGEWGVKGTGQKELNITLTPPLTTTIKNKKKKKRRVAIEVKTKKAKYEEKKTITTKEDEYGEAGERFVTVYKGANSSLCQFSWRVKS